MPGSCSPLSDLERLLAGLLPADEFEAVASHVEGCTICQQRLEELQRQQRRDLSSRANRHQAFTTSEAEVLERIKQRGHELGEPPHEFLGWLAHILLHRIKQWLRFWHRDRRCEVALGRGTEPVVHHAAPDEGQELASLQR